MRDVFELMQIDSLLHTDGQVRDWIARGRKSRTLESECAEYRAAREAAERIATEEESH